MDGLTKISGGIFGDRASAQAENFKKLLLTMSDDIRVILIKICDRLHNSVHSVRNRPTSNIRLPVRPSTSMHRWPTVSD